VSPPGAGNALNFDGSNDYVNAGNNFSLANHSFSIEFWAKRNVIGEGYILHKGVDSSNQCIQVGFRSTNQLRFGFYNNDLDTTKSFTDTYGSQLVNKSSIFYKAELPKDMSAIISEKCGGNPFYINAVIQQSAEKAKPLKNEKMLNEILAIDISSGFIYAELREQVIRWIENINEFGITKWVLYLAALEKGEKIDLHRIQRELKEQDRQDVDISTIESVLIKLSRGDLIDYKEFGKWFAKINDPILNEFLCVWGEIEVKYIKTEEVELKTVKKYIGLPKKFAEYKGYLAEVHMIQVLWNAQRKTIPGRFFNVKNKIKVPERFFYIRQRSRLNMGHGMEIDVYAAGAEEVWLAESKWQSRKIGVDIIRNMLKQAEIVEEQKGDTLEKVRLWLFASSGVTKKAQELIFKNQILLSTMKDLNDLSRRP
jgi:hypothetical protein